MRLPFDGSFQITQNFADPRYASSYQRFGIYAHNGIDYATPTWTPLLAPHKGTILEATNDPIGYGNYVKVQSDDETSVLAHMSKLAVNVGDNVEEGQLIGYSGNSGNSTGPHLHWGYFRTRTRNRQNGFNGYIDQTDWLDFHLPIIQISNQTKLDIGNGEMLEWQAIKSLLKDRLTKIIGLEMKVEDLEQAIARKEKQLKVCLTSPQKPPISGGNCLADLPISTLFLELVKRLSGR